MDKAAEFIGAEDPELLRMRGTDLQILEYYRIKNDTVQPLINWFHKSMNPRDADIKKSPIHKELSALQQCKVFYTTNYDDFIERAIRLGGREVISVASEHDLSRLRHEVQVIKFHGDFDRPGMMVLSESDYESRMRLETAMDLKLRSDVLGRALLFVGYSFRDSNVAYLFRLINEYFKDLPGSFSGRRAYIIYPNPSDFELQLFHARKVEVIPTSGPYLAEDAASILEEMRA
ncbi:MAG: SIR2 family protein [Haliea sp.]